MNKKLKITLGLFGLLIFGAVAFVVIGLYGMEIEDTYGDNQDIFYNSRNGDIIVNHQTKELGKIHKTWKRFYVINNFDTIDERPWWNDKNIEIYEFDDSKQSYKDFRYDEIDRLKGQGIIELKRRLR